MASVLYKYTIAKIRYANNLTINFGTTHDWDVSCAKMQVQSAILRGAQRI